ncbi:oligosaccharide flippase family protein [Vibrio parahaemolyticus]|uniref:oligosaccharide flippase family protein n=1 Tax=Vibrio parahaemolyticus TaxID=670 RepID=UPI0032AEC64D|nr:oligosaccharide flippase family protein [Vibrio parahaemolyticus]
MKNNVIYISSHIITFISGLILTLLLPRFLSVSDYASLSIEISLLNMLLPIATFGLTPYIIRNFKKQETMTYHLRDTVFFLFVIGNALAFFIFALYLFIKTGAVNVITLFLVVSSIIVTSLITVSSGLYRVKKEPIKYFCVVSLSKFFLLVFVLSSIFYFHYWENEYYFFSLLISGLLVALICKGDMLPKRNINKTTKCSDYVKSIFFCLPIVISNVLVMFVPFLERTVIDTMLSKDILAQYVFNFEVSSKISAVVLLSLKILIWPNIVDSSEKEEKAKYKKYGLKVVFVLISTVAIIFVFGRPLYEIMIDLFLSESYNNFIVFLYAVTFSALSVLLYYINLSVLLSGKTYIMTIGCLIISFSHYTGLVYLVPIYGVIGACISSVVSVSAGIVFSLVFNFEFFVNRKKVSNESI